MILQFYNVIINTDNIAFISSCSSKDSNKTGIGIETVAGTAYKFYDNDIKEYSILKQ